MKVEGKPIEGFYVEINLHNQKWLISCSYNPHKNNISAHLDSLSKSLDLFSTNFERIILLGDFNVGVEENHMKSFCEIYGLQNLIKQPTCYKNPDKPTCIDLMLTNVPRNFQGTCVVETGLSDFHLMTLTVMRKSFKKFQPKIINYRSYKTFSNEAYRETLIKNLSKENFAINDNGFERFCEISLNSLEKHAPRKKKYARGNQMPFFNKELSQAIMTRTRLRNIHLQDKSEENRIRYARQRNFCVSLLRKTKKKYYQNLNEKSVVDNKCFWKTVKPFLSDKTHGNDKIHLIENNELLKTDVETAEVFNEFFSNIVQKLNIPRFANDGPLVNNISDPTLKAILKYRKHPGVIAIRDKFKIKDAFSFVEVDQKEIEKEILSMDVNKASQGSDIPTKIVKENVDIFGSFVCTSFKNTIKLSNFYENLKYADVTPLHKKGKKDLKGNYRPVSILPNLSKIFEKCMFKQITQFFDKIFSKYQCGFRKGFSTQHCLLAMLEKWKSSVDKGKVFGALLTDLSKAFDCLDHELLIAKLNAYGFSLSALKLIHSYLSNRKQRTKINSSYSSWQDILFGVPQGSILGPLLFNIYLIDLFFTVDDTDIASYADDNTPYMTSDTIEGLIQSLEEVSIKLFKWFDDNLMKSNTDKCHLLVNTNESVKITIRDFDINSSRCEKLLGVKFDNNSSFDEHIADLCKKGSRKLHALSRVTPYMNFSKRRILMNAFFKSQFSYCPLVWMCHSRANNNKINRLHERCLRVIYSDKQSSFQTLLEKDGSVSIHNRNLQFLATEMYKVKHNLSPSIMAELFEQRNENYNLRNYNPFTIPAVRTVHHGSESISFLGPKIWNILPDDIKNAKSLNIFKTKIKSWKPENCPCRLCRVYIQNVGFV